MALTSTEEALVRQLIDQQAALLSLATSESTIISKLGATKVTLSDLVSASAVADADLFLLRQGTTDKSVTPLVLRSYTQDGVATQNGVQAGDYNTSNAGGTSDALTGDYTPNVAALENGLTLYLRAAIANATTAPTFSPDGLTAKPIVKGNDLTLVAGDIAGAGHWLEMQFDSVLDKWVLQNPAKGVSIVVNDASETVKGVVELATVAESQTGTDTVRAVTPQGVARSTISNAQTWQDVEVSRALGVVYQNTSGSPIEVSVNCSGGSGAYHYIDVGPSNAVALRLGQIGAANIFAMETFIVPNNWYYRVSQTGGSSLIEWKEMRL